MNDPAADRTEPALSGREADRRGPVPGGDTDGRRPVPERGGDTDPSRPVPGRRAAVVSVARAVCVATGLVTAYYLLPLDRPGSLGASAVLGCGLVAVVVVFLWEVRAIVRSPWPRLKAVEALAATVVLYLVLFASVYYLLERSTPGSFSEPLNRTDALYFTLTTFATVGFGDIAARSQPGRIVTMLQMVGGLLLVGVAARVLAGAVQAGLRRQGREPPE